MEKRKPEPQLEPEPESDAMETDEEEAPMPGLDFGLELGDLSEEELVEHYRSLQRRPTALQRTLIREYTDAVASKFKQFSKAELSVEDSDSMEEWIFDTFDIERANALLKLLHDRNTNTSTATYREMVRLRSMVSAFSHTLSGAAYGYTNEPPVLRADARLRATHITWCRNVDDLEPTAEQWKTEQAEYYRRNTEKRTEFLASKQVELARVRDCEGGYVHTDVEQRHAPCPYDWSDPSCSNERLRELVNALFTDSHDGAPESESSARLHRDCRAAAG